MSKKPKTAPRFLIGWGLHDGVAWGRQCFKTLAGDTFDVTYWADLMTLLEARVAQKEALSETVRATGAKIYELVEYKS